MQPPPPPPPPPGPPWQSQPYGYPPPAPPARPAGRNRNGMIIGIVAGVVVGALVLCGAVAVGIVVIDRTGVLDEAGGDPTDPPPPTGPVEWLALERNSPSLDPLWQQLADEFVAAGGGAEVTVESAPSDAFPALLSSRLQQLDPPDLFYSQGGNRLRRHVEAGLLRDITDDLADVIATMPPGILAPYTVDGRVYGLPYHTATLGIWYNRALFADAGLDPDRPPQTWEEFLAAVAALKDAGTTPVAIAGADDWPTLFWYGCLATRVAGVDGFVQAGQQRSLSENPDFLRAAQLLTEFIDAEPFQPGHETATYAAPGGQADLVATGAAAMELMGNWAPGVYEVSASGGLGEDLGWFPFPAVEGGNGDLADLYGGGDGFAVGSNAPDATIELLRFVFSDDSYQRILAADQSLISVRADAEAPADDPNLGRQLAAIQSAPTTQVYVESDLPAELSVDLFDSMGQLLTGTTTPEEFIERITAAWQVLSDD